MTADTAARGSVADDHSSRIVVGVDGSPSSVETLRWAGTWPDRCAAASTRSVPGRSG